ncbi:hypothetical protein KVF89_28880 [Nocardioides carbamazepini]|uniref:hypothetical protein n=1 Tax=Nocardioides carbamazepini TaxID=2854259 RepID=UPI00214A3961|nr:hypothetical protein [Nocardioides carbamazepini]MCR1786584.1 hypothetical protein [Nocardioides carbamazepini]
MSVIEGNLVKYVVAAVLSLALVIGPAAGVSSAEATAERHSAGSDRTKVLKTAKAVRAYRKATGAAPDDGYANAALVTSPKVGYQRVGVKQFCVYTNAARSLSGKKAAWFYDSKRKRAFRASRNALLGSHSVCGKAARTRQQQVVQIRVDLAVADVLIAAGVVRSVAAGGPYPTGAGDIDLLHFEKTYGVKFAKGNRIHGYGTSGYGASFDICIAHRTGPWALYRSTTGTVETGTKKARCGSHVGTM